jgi:glycosyltransferase involved in cell wall biosynthesis
VNKSQKEKERKKISKRKKKVLLLVNSLEHGGTERVIMNLAEGLKEKYDIKILALFDRNIYQAPVPSETILKVKRPILFPLLLPAYILKLKKILKKENPDLLICFLEFGNILNVLTRKKIKTIISVRAHMSTVYEKRRSKYLILPVVKALYPRADIVLVNSESAKADLVTKFNVKKEKIKVIYNPLDNKKIKKLSEENLEDEYKALFKRNFVIINVGRLDAQKGQLNLIRIFKDLKVKENVKLAIVGGGQKEKELKKALKDWNLEKKVTLLGDRKNPFKYMKHSKIFVFTSFYEGLPNALLEAMSCGLPIITTDCNSGPREILNPQSPVEKNAEKVEYATYGVLCPAFKENRYLKNLNTLSNEEVLFKNALENLINNKALMTNYSKKSIERSKEFDTKIMIKRFEEFIEEQTK